MKRMLNALLALALLLSGCASSRENAPGEKTEDHFSFQAGDVTVTLNAPAGAILEALGQPEPYDEMTGCGLCQTIRTYCLDGFFMLVQPDEEGEDRITDLWFSDETLKTPEGIGIGDSRDAVKMAYGSFSGDAYLRRKGEERMLITLDGDTVSSVQFFADTGCDVCGGSAGGSACPDSAQCQPSAQSPTIACPQPSRTPIPGS